MKPIFLSLVAVVVASVAPVASADEVKTDLYTVVDGNKVDAATLEGFKAWRQANCAACHGANQEGLAGPSLVNSLKTLTKEEFVTTVTNGRIERGMPPHSGSPLVMENMNKIYSYLKGRSNGDIKTARVSAIE
jgi:mono/diheme cytochrome c family protein